MVLGIVTAAPFFGWRVVAGTFVLAVFGWGLGFYGPPVYLHAVQEARHWSVALVSSAVTVHFLVGAIVVANLPALYRRFGLPTVTKVAPSSWHWACWAGRWRASPWELLLATLLSGAGWVRDGRGRRRTPSSRRGSCTSGPAALATAYNGASIGGVVFSPLWVLAIASFGFPLAAAAIGAVMVVTIWLLADLVFSRTPQNTGQLPDGELSGAPAVATVSAATSPAGPPAVARPELSHAGGRDGLRPVRPDRAFGASLLAAGAALGRAGRRHPDGPGDGAARSPAAPWSAG